VGKKVFKKTGSNLKRCPIQRYYPYHRESKGKFFRKKRGEEGSPNLRGGLGERLASKRQF